MDAVPNKATKFRLVNRLRDAQRARGRNCSRQLLVLSSDRSCDLFVKLVSLSRESYWEDYVIGVDCHTDVYRRLQSLWNVIHIVRTSCTNSRVLRGTTTLALHMVRHILPYMTFYLLTNLGFTLVGILVAKQQNMQCGKFPTLIVRDQRTL